MYKYIVEENSELTATTNLLTLRHKDGGAPLLFQPGQYAAIGFKRKFRPTAVRCFSIASSPTEQDKLQFSIRIKGRYTSAVKNIQAGDEIFVRGPYGGFVMNTHEDDDVVFFAGGIGIAPFMGMMEYATTLQLKNRIHLIYSCQTQDDIPFLEKLKAMRFKNDKLTVTYVMGNEPLDILAGERVAIGRVDEAMLEKLGLDFAIQKFFICGPPPYMNAVTKLLKTHQVPSDMIITEAFGQGSNRQTGAIRSWPFNIYAVTSLGIIIGGFVIMTMDLARTIPKLEGSATISASDSNSVISASGKTQKAAINSVKPLVGTNTKQEAIVIAPTTPSQSAQQTQPTTTYTAPPATPQTPTPAPISAPAPKPTTRVS